MRTRTEYAAWHKKTENGQVIETYNNLSRKEWLTTMRIIFKVDTSELIKEIRDNQTRERLDFEGYYNPATFLRYPYHVPVILAQYNIFPDRQWWYVQPHGKKNTIIHAARKLVAAAGHDPETFHNDLSFVDYDLSFLDPAWTPTLRYGEIDRVLDELSDINYHDLRSHIEENLTKKAA